MGRRYLRYEKQPSTTDILIKWAPLVGIIASFVGGMLVKSFTGLDYFYRNVATIPYVDSKHVEALKYTDEKTAEALKTAIDHSDLNRQAMMTAIAAQSADIKAVGAKLDTIATNQAVMQDYLLKRKH